MSHHPQHPYQLVLSTESLLGKSCLVCSAGRGDTEVSVLRAQVSLGVPISLCWRHPTIGPKIFGFIISLKGRYFDYLGRQGDECGRVPRTEWVLGTWVFQSSKKESPDKSNELVTVLGGRYLISLFGVSLQLGKVLFPTPQPVNKLSEIRGLSVYHRMLTMYLGLGQL